MTGNINNNPVADPPAAQPGKEKKARPKFSAQASKRIEDLFTDLDREPLFPQEELPDLEEQPIAPLEALLGELEAAQEYLPPEIADLASSRWWRWERSGDQRCRSTRSRTRSTRTSLPIPRG